MAPRILLTTTSFMDTVGEHRDILSNLGYEVVQARGPLTDKQLLDVVSRDGPFDGILCGEDDVTGPVLRALAPRTRVISKYGVGLDRIDLETAQQLGIAVTNTPGVNHTTVTELTFGLLLSLVRKIPEHNAFVHKGEWRRITGAELSEKTLGIIGFGRVGKEVAKRALAFGMKVLVFNTSWSASHNSFVTELNRVFADPVFGEDAPSIRRSETVEELLENASIISLHINLTKNNSCFLDRRKLALCRRGSYLVNVSRGGLVDQRAVADAIRSGQLAGYAADVVDPEPITDDNPLRGLPNVHFTPHVGSRTVESVIRQGCAAVKNLVQVLGASEVKNAVSQG